MMEQIILFPSVLASGDGKLNNFSFPGINFQTGIKTKIRKNECLIHSIPHAVQRV